MKIAFTDDGAQFNGVKYMPGQAVTVTQENLDAFKHAGIKFTYIELPKKVSTVKTEAAKVAEVVAVALNPNTHVTEVDSSNSAHKNLSQQQQSISDKEE